jgi:RNA polymerase sigma factor (sigma-70 family)
MTTSTPIISTDSASRRADIAGSEGAPGDLLLLQRYISTRDAAAFGQIVQRYSGCVYATCLRVLGDSARAEEISQETFFRLLRRPADVTENLGGWLHRTATHLAIDTLRSDNARQRREINYARDNANVPNPHEATTWAELSPCIDQALTELPRDLRDLLVQHFLVGKSQSDLANQTGQSPATVSRRIRLGLEELRKHLRLKGVYALPAALALLLSPVSARQAPASLLRELGKMTLLTSAASTATPAKSWSPIEKRKLLTTMGGIVITIAAVEMLAHMSWKTATPAAHAETEHVAPERN